MKYVINRGVASDRAQEIVPRSFHGLLSAMRLPSGELDIAVFAGRSPVTGSGAQKALAALEDSENSVLVVGRDFTMEAFKAIKSSGAHICTYGGFLMTDEQWLERNT